MIVHLTHALPVGCAALAVLGAMSFLTLEAQAAPSVDKAGKLRVYLGTYTEKKSKGIYAFDFDLATGRATEPQLVAETTAPSFLAIHPNQKYLYAVNEVANYEGSKNGYVTAYSIDKKSGKLKELNHKSSKGGWPCHLSVDHTGKNVLVANYASGNLSVLPIQSNGSIGEATGFVQHQGTGPDKARQEGPHAHSIYLDASNRYALAADLGLDKVMVYKFDPAKGTITANEPPYGKVAPGAGPRHIAQHPNGHFAYAVDEMGSSVTVFAWDGNTGSLKQLQAISTLPEGFKGSTSCAEIQITPDGRYLYASNRGHDSLAIFSVDAKSGKLTAVGHQSTLGKTPRGFDIDPTGQYVIAANQDSDSVAIFKINQATGLLVPTGQTLEVGNPVCVVMMPIGK